MAVLLQSSDGGTDVAPAMGLQQLRGVMGITESGGLAMRICRFDDNRLGVVTDTGIHDDTQALIERTTCTYPLPVFVHFFDTLPTHLQPLAYASRELLY